MHYQQCIIKSMANFNSKILHFFFAPVRLFLTCWGLLMFTMLILGGCRERQSQDKIPLRLVLDNQHGTISVFRDGEDQPVAVQNAKPDFRPYLHPVAAPDGKGLVTEYSPEHHKHQTGLYWGFTRVNGQKTPQDSVRNWFYRSDKTPEQKKMLGRDFFHNPGADYWKRVSYEVVDSLGDSVSWRTVYHMLDENRQPILEETQFWTMQEENGQFYLDLEWKGKALKEITIGEYEYGGLFLRMPWKEGTKGEVVNFARQINQRAEGQRSLWVDVGMQVDGREDYAHVAIFDHPENGGFPQTWRVDGQMGVGPVRARMGDWKIRKGETETIKHRLVIYTGTLNDLDLTEKWKQYIGSDNLYATAGLWNIARQEGRQAKFLTADEAVAEMTLKEGYRVNAWASEPMITQPMAFCWDDKGRMWVAENRDYESRSRGFSGSGDSRILILEDTDRDGRADKRKVFAEGIPFPSAIAVGFDGVFVGAPPNLLFIPDRDGDDRADMEDIEVRLTGWGIRDRHETINSFHWGPDGWLYGLEGFATPSKIRKPRQGGKLYRHNEPFPEDLLEAEGVDINGGVWRYHPTKDRFEVVAHGFSNPWGIDYDAKGQLFISACVIPHLFHVIPGGIYHRQGGQHFSPYVYDDIKTIVDHRHRSAHGGARVYLSDAFPEDQRGRIFMANIHEHAVLSDILEPRGSGFIAHHGDDFLLANNAQWIGFSMEIGPEGDLYVLDWHDADICGEDVLHKETGRIFRIAPEKSLALEWPGRYSDLNELTDLELARLQQSPSVWHARRARVILQNRAHKGTVSKAAVDHLQKMFTEHGNIDFRLRAMWALHITGTLSRERLLEALSDTEEYIRSWSIQLLCENGNPGENVLEKMALLAAKDPSAVVRLYLSAALQRIPLQDRWKIGAGLVSHGKDVDDHNIPKMIWFGMEPAIASDIEKGLTFALESKLPIVAEYVARRAVEADRIVRLLEVVQVKSPNQMSLLKGLQAELESRTDIKPPANWEKCYGILKSNKATAGIAVEIAQQFGDAQAANQLMFTLADANASLEKKQTALTNLASRKWLGLKSKLPGLVDDPELSTSAIRAIAQYSDPELGWMLFSKYSSLGAEQKSEVVMTLASRRVYADILVEAISEESIPRSDIPAYVARQLRRVMGNGFVEIWGPIDDISEDTEVMYAKYRTLLTDRALGAANAAAGKKIFMMNCGSCHQMYGQGGNLGPDITGSNRTNLDYLLTNMIEPDAEVQDDYKMVVVTLRDGRTYLGNVASETPRQLIIRVVGQDQVMINKSEIQSREETPNSMMPTGLLNNLTDQELLDLVSFLRLQQEI